MGRIPAGGNTSPELQVDYTTGFFTTGRDWWIITWEYEGENKVYFTDPVNLRGLIDFLEKAGNITIKGALAAAAGAVITSLLFNSEGTSGFKQHILRKQDAGKLTTIVINKGNEVEWKSASGSSTTGSSYISA